MGLARGFGLLPAGGCNEDTVGKDPYILLAVAELEDEEPPKDMPEDEESEGEMGLDIGLLGYAEFGADKLLYSPASARWRSCKFRL